MALYQENPTIAAIDDISAALSATRESILILTQRWRETFRPEDFDELQRILDACDRIQEYHLIVRALASHAHYEATEKPPDVTQRRNMGKEVPTS